MHPDENAAGQAGRKRLNKWLVLALVFLVHMFAIGIPWTVMPVLFSTTAGELKLSLGEIGLLWSMLPVGAAIFALPGGMLGDRIGFTKSIGIGCLAVAAVNALRGLSGNIAWLTVTMFLCGATVALIFPNLQRIAALFFPRRQLGLATGISISGFAVGGVLSTALSATVMMPLLNGWRNVLYLYSSLCAVIGIAWFVIMRNAAKGSAVGSVRRPPFRESLVAVFRAKEAWLLSIGNLGVVGSFISLNGYLPVYLERIGLSKTIGDTMSSTLFMASIAGAIGIPAVADRIGAMKAVMIACALATSAAVVLIAFAGPALLWVLIPLAGGLTQGVGTLVVTYAVQVKQIGSAYAGTALGLIGGFANLGGFVMPALGGRLAETNQTWPFIFWALAALSGTACFLALKENRRSAAADGRTGPAQ